MEILYAYLFSSSVAKCITMKIELKTAVVCLCALYIVCKCQRLKENEISKKKVPSFISKKEYTKHDGSIDLDK